MAQSAKVRKPPRVVFSLGVPMPMERRAVRQAKRLKITRNAYIVRALAAQLGEDERSLVLPEQIERAAS